MATRTSTQSGNWGDTSTWVGGILPADGDDVIVAEGHSVRMNVDQRAWTGLLSVTIQGSASGTPGMLYWMNGYSGYLKVRSTGSTVLGTAQTNKGRILINSDGVWNNTGALANSTKAIMSLRSLTGTNLEIRIYCTQPTNKKVRVYGTRTTVTVSGQTFTGATLSNGTYVTFRSSGTLPTPLDENVVYIVSGASGNTFKIYPLNGSATALITCTTAGTGTLEVFTGPNSGVTTLNILDTDLTADTPWTNAANHNYVCLVSGYTVSIAYQYNTISSISSTTITLTNATTAALMPLAYVVLAGRNVVMRHETSESIYITSLKNSIISCSIFALTTAGALQNANQSRSDCIWAVDNCTLDSVICGFTTAAKYSTTTNASSTINGIILCCYYGISGPLSVNNVSYTLSFEAYGVSIIAHSLFKQTLTVSGYGNNTIFYLCGYCAHYGTIESSGEIFGQETKYCTVFGTYIAFRYLFNSSYKCFIPDTVVVKFAGVIFFTNSYKNNFAGTLNGCQSIFGGGYDNVFSGVFNDFVGWHIGSIAFTTGLFKNCSLNLPIRTWYASNTANHSYMACIQLSNINSVSTNDGVFEYKGSITRTVASSGAGIPVAYDGTNDMLMVHSLLSNLCKESPLVILDGLKVWCDAGSRTLRIRLVNGFTTQLIAGDLTLIVIYNKGDASERLVVETGTITTATDWSQFMSASFTQGDSGFVEVFLALNKYELNSKLFVWPWPEVI